MIAEVLEQFKRMKEKYPDSILLFRNGRKLVCYGSDAVSVSNVCQTKLVKDNRLPRRSAMQVTWFNHWDLDWVLPKIVRAGYRVAILERLVDPKKEAK